MKFFLFLVCLVGVTFLATPKAAACLGATQQRSFVLGAAGDQIFVLEITQIRGGHLDEGDVWHRLSPTLVAIQFNSDGSESKRTTLYSGLATVLKNGETQWLRSTYDSFLKWVGRRPGFVPAILSKKIDCDYLSSCQGFSLSKNHLHKKSQKYAIEIPPLFRPEDGTSVDVFQGMGFRGIEYFRIGSKRYVRATLGRGWDMNPCDHIDENAFPNCKDDRKETLRNSPRLIRKSIVHQSALHHGVEWDTIVSLQTL